MRFVKDIIARDLTYECEVCDIVKKRLFPAGGIIFSNSHVVVYTHLSAPIRGMIVVAPIRHVSSFDELDEQEISDLMSTKDNVCTYLADNGISETRVIQVNGAEDHARLWVMPAFMTDEMLKFVNNVPSLKRRSIEIAQPYDILFLTRKLRGCF